MKRIALAAGLFVLFISSASAQHSGCQACASKARQSMSPFAHMSWYLGLCEPVYVCDQRFRCKSPLRCGRCTPCAESTVTSLAPPEKTPVEKAPALTQVHAESAREPVAPKIMQSQTASPDEQALLRTLRTDGNEAVRRQAALDLGRSGTRSFEVLKTLNLVISGSEQDGHRRETSKRVKEAALTALQQCLAGQRTASARLASTSSSRTEPVVISFPSIPTQNATQVTATSSDIVLPTPPPPAVNPFRAVD